MTTLTKGVLAFAVVAGLFGTIAFFGFSPFVKTIVANYGNTAAGTVFNSARFAGVVANLANPGANATSSSILNTDSNDRYVTGVRLACQGVGTSKSAYAGAGLASNGLTFSVATSSTAAPATNGNTNIVTAGPIGTSSPAIAIASTTAASPATGVAAINFVWASGSYLTFTVNATNTAVCTFGADYIGS